MLDTSRLPRASTSDTQCSLTPCMVIACSMLCPCGFLYYHTPLTEVTHRGMPIPLWTPAVCIREESSHVVHRHAPSGIAGTLAIMDTPIHYAIHCSNKSNALNIDHLSANRKRRWAWCSLTTSVCVSGLWACCTFSYGFGHESAEA